MTRKSMFQSFSFLLLLFFVIGGPGAAQAACLSGASPIGYWQLEAATADPNSFVDSGSAGNAGSCDGNCPEQAGGQVDFGQLFSGTDNVIEIPSDSTYNFSGGSFSVEFWMQRSNAPSGIEVMVARRDSTTSLAWWVGLDSNGLVNFSLRDSTNSANVQITGTTDVTGSDWHHITAVRDAAGANRLYVDGVLEASSNVTYTGSFTSDGVITIGDYAASGDFDFNGTLDEVALYDSALSTEVIKEHVAAGIQSVGYCEDLPAQLFADSTDAALGAEMLWPIEATGNPLPNQFGLGTGAPTGMDIDDISGEISWMPLDSDAGTTVAFDVTASNGVGATDTETFGIDVVDICAADKLAGYWKLEEATADPNVFTDASDNANNGACSGDCPQQATGQVGSGQSFAGVDDVVTVAADTAYDFTGSFAIELWMNRSAVPSETEVMVGRRDSTTELAWWVGLNTSGQAVFSLRDSTNSASVSITGDTDLTNGDWHHIVAIRDEGSGENRLYVDGALTAKRKVTYSGSFASDGDVTIGDYAASGNFDFNGVIDEVAIYTYALSDTMVMQHAMLVDHTICNGSPVIDAPGALSATEEQLFTTTLTATDADGDTDFTWSLSNAPTGMAIDNATGEVSWTPDNVSTSGTVTAAVDDGFGGTDTQDFTVSVTNVNDDPVITTTAPTTATVGVAYSYAADATDADAADTLTWALASGPTGMTIDASTGAVSWTPTSADVGDVDCAITVSDGNGGSDTQNFTVTVTDASSNNNPVISTTAPTTATVGKAYSYDADATDADASDTLTWTLDSGPNGMTIDASSGLVSWTPTSADEGDVDCAITVSDGNGGTATENFTITVGKASSNGGGGGGGGGCFISTLH